MRGRRLAYLCAAMVAILLVAVIDAEHTESQVPDVPALCVPADDAACNAARSASLNVRFEKADALRHDFGKRAWLYALAEIATIALAVGSMLRTDPREQWRRGFVDLGILGVCLAAATAVFALSKDWGAPGALIEPPAGAVFAPIMVALAIAAAGGIIIQLAGWEGQAGEGVGAYGPAALRTGPLGLPVPAIAALGLTAATFVLGLIYASPQPSCGGGDTGPVPGWTDTVQTLALISAAGAALIGLVSLLMRRWFVALVSFFANPVILLLMAASTCAFY